MESLEAIFQQIKQISSNGFSCSIKKNRILIKKSDYYRLELLFDQLEVMVLKRNMPGIIRQLFLRKELFEIKNTEEKVFGLIRSTGHKINQIYIKL